MITAWIQGTQYYKNTPIMYRQALGESETSFPALIHLGEVFILAVTFQDKLYFSWITMCWKNTIVPLHECTDYLGYCTTMGSYVILELTESELTCQMGHLEGCSHCRAPAGSSSAPGEMETVEEP